MTHRTYRADEIIFQEGDASSEAYRILSGSVEISIAVEGKKVVLARLAAGDIFGEMSMIDEHPRSATAMALEPVQAEMMTSEDFNRCIIQDPATLMPYLASFFERLRTTNERLRLELRHKDQTPHRTVSLERTRIPTPPIPGRASVALPRRDQIAADAPTIVPFTPNPATLRNVTLRVDDPSLAAESARIEVPVKKFPFRIGREEHHNVPSVFSSNDFVLHDEKPYQVSRNHCSIECENGHVFIRDRGSMVGTLVNGALIGAGQGTLTADLVEGKNTLVLGMENSRFRFVIDVE